LPELLEAFLDFPCCVKTTVKKKDEAGKTRYEYERYHFITPKEYPVKLTLEDLNAAVQSLQERYPDLGYRLVEEWVEEEVEGKIESIRYYAIQRERANVENPSLYINLDRGRLYVPKSYVRKKPRKVSVVLSYRLYALKIPVRVGAIDYRVKRRLKKLYPRTDRDINKLWEALDLLKLVRKREYKRYIQPKPKHALKR
jgi:hypothetical protein